MFTTQMIQLFAVVLGRDSERVTETLLGEGVMQFVGMSEFGGEKPQSISTVKPKVSLTEISDLRKRIEGFLHSGGIIPSAPEETHLSNRAPVAIGEEKARLDRINSERESIRERQRVIQQEVMKLEDIKRQVDLYGIGLSEATLPARHSFISMQIGNLPVSNVKQFEDALKAFPSLSVKLGQENEMSHHLMVTMKRDDSKIKTILANVGWTKIELPGELRSVKKDVFQEISAKIEKLTGEQKKLEKQANDLIKKEGEHLRKVWLNLRVNELFYKVQTNFESSSRTIIFTGWLPANKKERLTRKIKEASRGRCYLEWNEPDSRHVVRDEVPVQFSNPKVLAPFQMLVSNFGVPRYGDIDPTPFVMPLYLSMFGLMFADLGQGIVLAILGIIGASILRKQEAKKGLYHLCWLLIWCGASSMVFGTLFGSFFGKTFKPLWFDFHGIIEHPGHIPPDSAVSDVYGILAITIYFGITVIALGLLFNWINLIRSGRWDELFFDKGGVFGAWIYAGGIYIGYYMVSHGYKGLPSGSTVFLLAGLPSLLLFIKEPYHYFAHRPAHGRDKSNLLLAFMNMMMEWIVELLEIFAGYLSNTLSFMRVAGLGIAHVCLMISFFTLAEMTSGIGSIIILILGNLLVIGLEGLSAGIQALRLSYYEFFTKFFHGTGKLYTPISLKSEI